MASGSGRPRASAVWDYFDYDEEESKSVCQVTVEGGQLCGAKFSGKFPTNLRKHLEKHHSEAFIEFEKKEDKRQRERESEKAAKKAKSPTSGPSIEACFSGGKPYEKGSARHISLSRKLALFIGTSNVPNSLVANAEFLEFVRELNPRYTVPGRIPMSRNLDQLLEELKGKIATRLDEAGKIAITVDIWSKKGMSESFLGVTAHTFLRRSHKRFTVTLAVRSFSHPHTAERVLEVVNVVLREWKIETRISRVITDNGSNMVAAFKNLKHSLEKDGELSMSEDECNTGVSESGDLTTLTSSPSSNSDSNESGDDADEDIMQMGKDAEDEIMEFEEQELQHDMTISSCFSRAGCFAHTIQLVARKFDVFPSAKKVLVKVHRLVAKFNKSCRATERLISLAGKKLVADCPTRWSSTFLVVSRLLELRSFVSAVCAELSWNCLQNSEWKTLEHYKQLLDPFSHYTNLESAEDTTTISTVIPALMELGMHLEEMGQKPGLASISKCLLQDLNTRFKKVQDPQAVDFDPLYVAATFLDPRYKLLLSSEQTEAAKRMIINEVSRPTDISSEVEEVEEQPPEENEPPKKRFKHLAAVIARKKELLSSGKAGPSTKVEDELSRYRAELHEMNETDDPVDYWVSVESQYPSLSSVAYDVLVIPASSAPIERVFSTSGESCMGKRNRLSGKNLEREVLLKKNKQLLYEA